MCLAHEVYATNNTSTTNRSHSKGENQPLSRPGGNPNSRTRSPPPPLPPHHSIRGPRHHHPRRHLRSGHTSRNNHPSPVCVGFWQHSVRVNDAALAGLRARYFRLRPSVDLFCCFGNQDILRTHYDRGTTSSVHRKLRLFRVSEYTGPR